MASEVIAVFIPIVFTLVAGLVIVTYFYLRSRERQMLIDKGLSAESIKEFFESRKDPFRWFKVGIVSIFFGIGLGLGMLLQDYTHKDYWIVLLLFVFTGIGFVVANLSGNKLRQKADAENKTGL
jgi:general stress protein CsbA